MERSSASSGPTGPARRRRSGCCSASSSPPPATRALLGMPMPGAAARCCLGSGRSSRGRPSTLTCPGATTSHASTPLTRRASRRRQSSASRGPGPRRPDRGGPEALSGLLPRACGSVSASPAHCCGRRELLVLDEPTNGLDPQGTREVRRLVRELASEGSTIFVSSHLLTEVEQMCTHVGSHAGWTPGRPRTARRAAGGRHPQAAGGVRHAPAATAQVLEDAGLSNVVSAEDGASGDLGNVPSELIVERLVLAHVRCRVRCGSNAPIWKRCSWH